MGTYMVVTSACLRSFCAGTRDGAQVGPIVAILTGARPLSYERPHGTSVTRYKERLGYGRL